MLSTAGAVAAIAVMAIITFLTRALPFLLFDRGESPPKLVLYLGRVLPPAIIAMLIVYCLRGVSFAAPGRLGAPARVRGGGGDPSPVAQQYPVEHLRRHHFVYGARPGRVSLTQAPAPKRGGRFCPVQRVRRHITRSPWVSRSPVKRKPKDSYSAAAGRLASTTLR